MSTSQNSASVGQIDIPNGPGAAAILAAGIGCAAVGVLAFAGDASPAIGKLLNIYNPTGTLSGVTTLAIIVWLVVVCTRQALAGQECRHWKDQYPRLCSAWRWISADLSALHRSLAGQVRGLTNVVRLIG